MSAPETPARRRKLDPSPEEIRKAREQMERFLGEEEAESARKGYAFMRSEWSDANSYTLGTVISNLNAAANHPVGAEMAKFVRGARASLAALDEWKTARTAARAAEREAGDPS